MRSFLGVLLSLIVLSGCTSETADLEKKIEDLEEDVAYKQSVIEQLYDDLISKCTSSREDVTTFGPYSLTETVLYDTDWDCAQDTSIRSGYFEEGVKKSVVKKSDEVIYSILSKLEISEAAEFYKLSTYTGGAHCCTVDTLLHKKSPYGIAFTASSDGAYGIVVGDFDNDGKTEIALSDRVSLYWRGPYSATATIDIYLELDSNDFKIDKELTYFKISEEINNTQLNTITFDLIHEDVRNELNGWEDHYIPYELIKITGALLFSGRESEAKKILDFVWPEKLANKEEYWKEFKEMIKGSKYWEHKL